MPLTPNPLVAGAQGLDPSAPGDDLLDAIGDARFVLFGEASHGTAEFYRMRDRLTRRLITECGFTAVAVEADWPDAYRVNRYVRGQSDDRKAQEALADFTRFPTWMWRNREVAEFTEWLHGHNSAHSERPVGFYGLDLYSMHRSMDAVVDYLADRDPEAAARARDRYGCFDSFGSNPHAYGRAAEHGGQDPCEAEAIAQLVELQRRDGELAAGDPDEHFFAEQNARLARNAETYYRAIFRGREESWNVRDTHMADSLDALADHLSDGEQAKLVVWAHNSHLGDARASAMGWRRSELNLGQLVRERHPDQTFVLGQTTYRGSVFASDEWNEPGRIKTVNDALAGSVEARLHEVGRAAYWLDLRDPAVADALADEQLQRFIGVNYRPDTERWSHYVETRPAQMYDALIHLDTTTALVPLDRSGGVDDGDLPDTFPTGE